MHAVVVKEFGPISSHTIGELPDPRPSPGQVLVTIKATAVNYIGSLVVTGKYQFLPERPFAPGKLPAGVISALGPGVSDFQVGDRILTLAEQGGHAERIAVDATQCFRLPRSMSFIEAASMALVYDASWFALRERARVRAGESVLVLGSTGSVGLAAVQLAKAMGARVLAAVSSSPAKGAIALGAEADDVIDLSKENLRDSLHEQVFAENGGEGVDIVVDPIGGDAFDPALRALAWRGRFVVIALPPAVFRASRLTICSSKNIEVCGLQVSDYRKRTPDLMAQCVREIFAMFEAGKLRPSTTTTCPLNAFANPLQGTVDRRERSYCASSQLLIHRRTRGCPPSDPVPAGVE